MLFDFLYGIFFVFIPTHFFSWFTIVKFFFGVFFYRLAPQNDNEPLAKWFVAIVYVSFFFFVINTLQDSNFFQKKSALKEAFNSILSFNLGFLYALWKNKYFKDFDDIELLKTCFLFFTFKSKKRKKQEEQEEIKRENQKAQEEQEEQGYRERGKQREERRQEEESRKKEQEEYEEYREREEQEATKTEPPYWDKYYNPRNFDFHYYENNNPFQVLGVTKDTDFKIVKKKYRDLTKRFHADTNQNVSKEEEKYYTELSGIINNSWHRWKKWQKL